MKKIMKYLLLVNIIMLVTFISIGDINVNAGTLTYSHQFTLEEFILDEYNNLSGVNWNTKNVYHSAAYRDLGRRFYIDTEKQQPISLYSKEEFYSSSFVMFERDKMKIIGVPFQIMVLLQ